MKQTTNTAATTLEQVNAMPAATWGWLKMNQTKLELSDELAAAPAETVKVEGLDEQFAGVADAFDAAMDAMAERFPERRASAPGDAADRARITPETNSPPSTRPVPLSWRRSSPPLRPSRLAWARLPTPTWPTTPPSASSSMCPHTSTPRLPCV
ncbi:MAG: hypothetical protein ACLS3Y_07280 [Collinsella sp.]